MDFHLGLRPRDLELHRQPQR